MFSQISRVVFILIFINVANGLGDSNGIDLSKCSYLKTNDYAYSFYPIQEVKNGSGIFLTFKVKAKRDALIIFSPTNEPAKNGQQVFEVVLGGYGNTRSTIRTTPKGGEEISYNETNIVSSEKWNHFWIRINSNGSLIEVGKNNSDGSSAIMTFKTKPRTIKYYGFSSWNYENEVEWAFQCSKNDNSVEDVSKCRAVNTEEYMYTYYPIDDIKTATGIFLTFNVKAGRDALIIFSPTDQPNKNDKVFEVVLGGYRNTRSMIRITPTGGEVTTRNETDILSPEKWRKFWIRINSNGSLIEVGKHGKPAFMSVKNQSRPIKYYGFASWIDKNPVNWTFSCIQNNKTDKCRPTSLTTTKYDYQLFPIDYLVKNEHGILLNFSVKAERDAHILLSSTNQTVSRGQNDYEIVLGSHRNTKSEIRPSTNESNEKDIVSLKEWRTFWIRVSSDGLIEVGKNGNKSSFMSWNATGGTNFTHFGFASWNGNSVNWMIHCSQIRDDKNKTKNDKILAKDLLTNYSRSTPPNGNGTFLDQANITIVIQNSTFSDPESVEINGLAKITWKDNRLAWVPKLYNNLSTWNMDYGLVWTPDITIKNNQLANNISLASGNVTISYNGSVSWTTPLHIKISCLPKGKNWRKSQLTCKINSTYIASHVDLKISQHYTSTNNETAQFFFNKTQNLQNIEPDFTVDLIYENQITKNLSACKQITTNSYDYKFYPINGLKNASGVYLNFFVKGENNAHIIFSSNNKPVRTGEKVYEIVLGAYENTRSVIRLSPTGDNLYKHEVSNIISPDEWRQFWIRIRTDGLIEVGENGGSEFMNLETELIPIEYFGFASWKNGNIVNWVFQCPE